MFFLAVEDVRAFLIWICKTQMPKTKKTEGFLFIFFKVSKTLKISYLAEDYNSLLPLSLQNSLILFVHFRALIILSELKANSVV